MGVSHLERSKEKTAGNYCLYEEREMNIYGLPTFRKHWSHGLRGVSGMHDFW
jgi:hypothetical protein